MMDAYLEMGRVLDAHNQRHWMRGKLRAVAPNVERARKELNDFGMYADCGTFYTGEYESAKAVAQEYLSLKISIEKYFKKLKLTFMETYPDLSAELEKRIAAQAKKHTEDFNDSMAAELARKKEQELEEMKRRYPWKYQLKMRRKEKKKSREGIS